VGPGVGALVDVAKAVAYPGLQQGPPGNAVDYADRGYEAQLYEAPAYVIPDSHHSYAVPGQLCGGGRYRGLLTADTHP